MDIKELRYFVRVAELGSFSKASSFLNIAQPALSRHVQHLETEFKEPLFIRTGRGVELTEPGKRLLDHARSILALVDETRESMEAARKGSEGRISVGMPPTLSETMALPLIMLLREKFPAARLSIHHGRSTQLQEMLLNSRLDMALVLDAPRSPMIECFEVSEKPLGLLGHEAIIGHLPDPLPLETLAVLPLILPGRPNKVRLAIDSEMALLGLPLDVSLECDSFSTAYRLTQEKVGCSVRFARSYEARDGLVFRTFDKPKITLRIDLIVSTRRPINKVLDTAIEMVVAEARERLF